MKMILEFDGIEDYKKFTDDIGDKREEKIKMIQRQHELDILASEQHETIGRILKREKERLAKKKSSTIKKK